MQVCFPTDDVIEVAGDVVAACDSSNLLEIDCWIYGVLLESIVTTPKLLIILALSLFSLSELDLFSFASWL